MGNLKADREVRKVSYVAPNGQIYTESDLAESTKGKTWQDMLIPPSR